MLKELNTIVAGLLGLHGYQAQPPGWPQDRPPCRDAASEATGAVARTAPPREEASRRIASAVPLSLIRRLP